MLRLAAALLASCALLVESHAADVPTFEGIGRAPISGGDRVRARQRALDEAFARAVESAVSALLGAETLTRRAADLRLKILPRAKTYVTTFRVLEEGEVEAGLFDVHVSAEIAAERLLRDLQPPGRDARLPAAPGAAPRLVLCIASEVPGGLPRLDAAQRALVGARGLEAVPVPPPCDDEELGRAIKRVGARAGLAAAVEGAAAAPIRGTTLVGREGKLVLRLVEPDGRRSAEGQGEGAGFGASAAQAADELAGQAMVQAGQAIEGALVALAGGATRGTITARLVGVRRLAQVTQVRQALERVAGVEGVEPRRFLPGVAGVPGNIELAVRTGLTARSVAEAVARLAGAYQLRTREQDGVVVVEVPEPHEPPPPGPAQ